MKKIVRITAGTALYFSALVIMTMTSLEVQAQAASNTAIFSWESGMVQDFGEIAQNEPVSHKFEFQNTGSAPLIISSVKASCGCTVTNYSQGSVLPGEKGSITATYNAKKSGAFNKTITVNANTGSPVMLVVKGTVKENNTQ